MSVLVANLTSPLPSSFAKRLLFGASKCETGNYFAVVDLFYKREIDRASENWLASFLVEVGSFSATKSLISFGIYFSGSAYSEPFFPTRASPL